MDTGIAEDVRKHKDTADPQGWLKNPGPRFLTLNVDRSFNWFVRTENEVIAALQEQLDRFNKISTKPALTVDSWRSFTKKFLTDRDAGQRSIVSALYVFLLEFRDHKRELLLREKSTAGSNQPFTVHLLAGGLIFESLLKCLYPIPPSMDYYTLNTILKMPAFRSEFGDKCSVGISANKLGDIHAAIKDQSIEMAFATTGKLRNTTGHNLVWDNIFDNPRNYVDLFEQEINAILHVISQKLIEPCRTAPTGATGPSGPAPMKTELPTSLTSTGPSQLTGTSSTSLTVAGPRLSGNLAPNLGKK
jgi:hypothetical protein